MEKEIVDLIVLFLIVSIVLAVGVTLITRSYVRKIIKKEKKIQEMNQKYQIDLLNNTLKTEEKERKALAEELHDNLTSKLCIVKLQLFNAYPQGGDELILKGIDECIEMGRDISHNLKSPILENFGLFEAIKDLVTPLQGQYSVEMLVLQDNAKRLDGDKELQLYRIVQEGVSNILKHSNANQIQVLWHNGSKYTALTLTDNGVGLNEDLVSDGAGMGNITSRAQVIGARFKLSNVPLGGTRLTLALLK